MLVTVVTVVILPVLAADVWFYLLVWFVSDSFWLLVVSCGFAVSVGLLFGPLYYVTEVICIVWWFDFGCLVVLVFGLADLAWRGGCLPSWLRFGLCLQCL